MYACASVHGKEARLNTTCCMLVPTMICASLLGRIDEDLLSSGADSGTLAMGSNLEASKMLVAKVASSLQFFL